MKSLVDEDEETGGKGEEVSVASVGGERLVGLSSSGSLLVRLIVLARFRLFSGGGGRSFLARRGDGEATDVDSPAGTLANGDRVGWVGVEGGRGCCGGATVLLATGSAAGPGGTMSRSLEPGEAAGEDPGASAAEAEAVRWGDSRPLAFCELMEAVRESDASDFGGVTSGTGEGRRGVGLAGAARRGEVGEVEAAVEEVRMGVGDRRKGSRVGLSGEGSAGGATDEGDSAEATTGERDGR